MEDNVLSIEFDDKAVEALKSVGICLATAIASAATKDPACLWALVILFFV